MITKNNLHSCSVREQWLVVLLWKYAFPLYCRTHQSSWSHTILNNTWAMQVDNYYLYLASTLHKCNYVYTNTHDKVHLYVNFYFIRKWASFHTCFETHWAIRKKSPSNAKHPYNIICSEPYWHPRPVT